MGIVFLCFTWFYYKSDGLFIGTIFLIFESLTNIRIQINAKTQIITPTTKGEAIYDVVNKSIPDMLNPNLTASWEKGLDMVAKKEIEPQIFMDKLEKYITSKIDKLVLKWELNKET